MGVAFERSVPPQVEPVQPRPKAFKEIMDHTPQGPSVISAPINSGAERTGYGKVLEHKGSFRVRDHISPNTLFGSCIGKAGARVFRRSAGCVVVTRTRDLPLRGNDVYALDQGTYPLRH